MSKDNSDFFKTKNSWSEIKDKLLGGLPDSLFSEDSSNKQADFLCRLLCWKRNI